ncbi:hypothetical protein FRC00_007582, partial [Tulasnella sp. 408]
MLLQNTSPSRSPKTIVLAFDGTANKFGACNTNVIRLFSMLEKDKPEEQVVYYQPGLGTYLASEAAWSPTEKAISELMDKAFARQNDRLSQVGLLLPGNDQMVASAYERYLDLSNDGKDLACRFKDAFSIDSSNGQVKTVRHALALDERRAKFKPHTWHRSLADCTWVVKRTPTLFSVQLEDYDAIDHGIQHELSGPKEVAEGPQTTSFAETSPRILFDQLEEDHDAVDRDLGAEPYGPKEAPESSLGAGSARTSQDARVTELRSAGYLHDVGGGRKPGEDRLSNPSLAWMINHIILSKAPILFKRKEYLKLPEGFKFASPMSEGMLGLMFDAINATEDIPAESIIYTDHLSPSESVDYFMRAPPTGPEGRGSSLCDTTVPDHEEMKHFRQADEMADAESLIHDSMTRTWLWRILEWIPLGHSTGFNGFNGWRWSIMPNLGQGREITARHVFIHESVLLRMDRVAEYVPKASIVREDADIKFVNNSGLE